MSSVRAVNWATCRLMHRVSAGQARFDEALCAMNCALRLWCTKGLRRRLVSAEHLRDGQEPIVVAVHLAELFDRQAAPDPLIQSELPITIRVKRGKPGRQSVGEISGPVN